MSTGAGAGSCCVGVLWRAAVGDMTRLRVEKCGRRYLLKLVRAAVVRDCVGARLVEIGRTYLRVEEYGKNYLMELARAALICEFVGAQLMEH